MKTLLGQRIREQRRKKGWTMDKLAEKADLSVNYSYVTGSIIVCREAGACVLPGNI